VNRFPDRARPPFLARLWAGGTPLLVHVGRIKGVDDLDKVEVEQDTMLWREPMRRQRHAWRRGDGSDP
jgi:hypothetical protein